MDKDTEKNQKRLHEAEKGEVYVYRDSGIQERHGAIPLWLKLVAIGLLVWGVYYTIRYWNTS
jgi:hypothetical protein